MKKILLCLIFALFVSIGCEKFDDLSNKEIKEIIETEQTIDEQQENKSDDNAIEDKVSFDKAEAFFQKGKELLDKDEVANSEEAIKYFEEGLKINKDTLWAWGDLGRAQLKSKKFKDAINSLTKAIELNNQRAIFYFWRAEAYEQLVEYNLAKQDRKIAEELHSKGLD